MNERDIASGFSAVWSELFPMLTPTFVIAFNEAFVRPIFGRAGILHPVPSTTNTKRADVLAEFAFQFAAAAIQTGVPVNTAAGDESILNAADLAATNRIHEFRHDLECDVSHLNGPERQEGVRLAAVYEEFLTMWPAEPVSFSPAIRGSGILRSCLADLAIGRTLFEVKTVSRPFRSRDLRQLLVYLALQSTTGERRWDHAGLFNPRWCRYCTFSVDWLASRLSGGRPPKVVFADFAQALTRDSTLDVRF